MTITTQSQAHTAIPESVETLLDWKLSNSDDPFDSEASEAFLADFPTHAQEANALFDQAVADFNRE